MSKRQKVNASSSSSEVDFVRLCEDVVQRIEEVLKRRRVLSEGQCKDLATRLSIKIAYIRKVVESYGRYKTAFVPLLAALHRYYEKAEALVKQCAEEDWCAAAVFQRGSHLPFKYIVEYMNMVESYIVLCANKYTAATKYTARGFTLGYPSSDFLGHGYPIHKGVEPVIEKLELRTRLEGVVSERIDTSLRVFAFFVSEQAALKKQHLARYLLKLMEFQYKRKDASTLMTIFWEKDNEPGGTWGDVKFLGSGSGASGVLKTSWLGVPCAKKVFHDVGTKTIFMKEALIMAKLHKHPNIVDFICCGDGKEKGDRFIAMELMENSLFDLIEERNGMHFSLDVALDIIQQIARGVQHFHDSRVAHRDLKPHNVVVKTLKSPHHEDYYCVKLVDFGTSKSEVEDSKSNTMSFRGVGTTRYRAPEAHPSAHPEGLGKVNWFKADVYSFAMTCAHVLTLSPPFEDLESLGYLYTRILEGQRPIFPIGCPKQLVELLKECWSAEPSKRPHFKPSKKTYFKSISERLNEIVLKNMLEPTCIAKDSLLVPSENYGIGTRDVKEEEDHIKEEGHTSFFTAEDLSFCNEVVSEERDSKVDVSKKAMVKLES